MLRGQEVGVHQWGDEEKEESVGVGGDEVEGGKGRVWGTEAMAVTSGNKVGDGVHEGGKKAGGAKGEKNEVPVSGTTVGDMMHSQGGDVGPEAFTEEGRVGYEQGRKDEDAAEGEKDIRPMQGMTTVGDVMHSHGSIGPGRRLQENRVGDVVSSQGIAGQEEYTEEEGELEYEDRRKKPGVLDSGENGHPSTGMSTVGDIMHPQGSIGAGRWLEERSVGNVVPSQGSIGGQEEYTVEEGELEYEDRRKKPGAAASLNNGGMSTVGDIMHPQGSIGPGRRLEEAGAGSEEGAKEGNVVAVSTEELKEEGVGEEESKRHERMGGGRWFRHADAGARGREWGTLGHRWVQRESEMGTVGDQVGGGG